MKKITLVIENESIFHSQYLKQLIKKFKVYNSYKINVCIYFGSSVSDINFKIILSCLKFNFSQFIKGTKFFLVNFFKRMINNELNIKQICKNNNIPYKKIFNNEDLINCINIFNTEYIINASSLIFSKDVFQKNIIMINKHSGQIPKYMGSYPLFWSFYNSEDKFFITINFIELAIDEGEVIYEKAFSTNNISLINCYFRSFIYSTYVITNLLRKPILTSVKKKIKQSSMKYRKPNQKDVDNFFKKKLSFF